MQLPLAKGQRTCHAHASALSFCSCWQDRNRLAHSVNGNTVASSESIIKLSGGWHSAAIIIVTSDVHEASGSSQMVLQEVAEAEGGSDSANIAVASFA